MAIAETRAVDVVPFAETGRGGAIWDRTTGRATLAVLVGPICVGPHLAMVHRDLSQRITAMVEDSGP